MSLVPFWSELGAGRRVALFASALALVLGALAAGAWLLHDPLVPLVADLRPDRVASLAQALERGRVAYRVSDDGGGIAVARSQLGKARAAVADGGLEAPPSVGLEVFKDADFSTTDFAQRINYQRALQGELTRTIQALSGVRSARVHVILPEAGLLRRASTPASAAVGVAMIEGRALSRAQVRGIQRLVAASVPGMRPADVAVFDDSGASLTAPAGGEGESEASTAQLELKRQVDGYLEAKLARLLAEVVGEGHLSLSVDATLDDRRLRVTTEEPLAAGGAGGKADGERPAGVLARERQFERAPATGASAGEAGAGAEPGEWEFEYRVGQRVEQTLAVPGSIRRLSVAVAVRGGPTELRAQAIEQLVAHGIGLDRARGDAVAVVLLPATAMPDGPAMGDRGAGAEHGAPREGGAPADRAAAADPLLAHHDVAHRAYGAGTPQDRGIAAAQEPVRSSARGGSAASSGSGDPAANDSPSWAPGSLVRAGHEPLVLAGLGGLFCAGGLLPFALRRRARRRKEASAHPTKDAADDEALAARIRGWLEGGA